MKTQTWCPSAYMKLIISSRNEKLPRPCSVTAALFKIRQLGNKGIKPKIKVKLGR